MRLARIRAALPALPAGLLERMRAVLVVVALVNAVPLLLVLGLERGAGIALPAAAMGAVAWVCVRWARAARHGRLGVVGDVGEALAFAVAGVALGSNDDADGLVIAALLLGLLLRALYASPPRLAAGALLTLGSLAGAALAAPALGTGSALSLSELPAEVAFVSTVAAVGYALSATLRRYDAALAREHELQLKLLHQASHDPLTGLPNRHEIEDRLDRAAARAARAATGLAVLFVDLDGFKPVNDELGHEAGDELLATVARRIQGCLRVSDSAGRLGGDEFGLVAEGIDRDDAVALAGRVVEAIAIPILVDLRTVGVRASVGVAMAGADAPSAGRLLGMADLAMYEAKRRGGGVVVYGEPAPGRVAAG